MDNVSGYLDVNPEVVPMPEELWVLLVYHEEDPVRGMERILLDQGISTRRVRNCSEARAALRGSTPPALVLTDACLPDGAWADVLEAANTVRTLAPVIVVSRLVDIGLYLDVLERGAYDFVVPPLSSADLAYIVGVAMSKGSDRVLTDTTAANQGIQARLTMTPKRIGQVIGASREAVMRTLVESECKQSCNVVTSGNTVK